MVNNIQEGIGKLYKFEIKTGTNNKDPCRNRGLKFKNYLIKQKLKQTSI
jgi:hypothetical protein